MTPLGNKLGDYSAGENYSSDLDEEQYSWEEKYSIGMLNDNSAGDTVVMLAVLIDYAGDEKNTPRTIFPWLLAEDNPLISSCGHIL